MNLFKLEFNYNTAQKRVGTVPVPKFLFLVRTLLIKRPYFFNGSNSVFGTGTESKLGFNPTKTTKIVFGKVCPFPKMYFGTRCFGIYYRKTELYSKKKFFYLISSFSIYKNIEAIATAGNTSPTNGTKMLGKNSALIKTPLTNL